MPLDDHYLLLKARNLIKIAKVVSSPPKYSFKVYLADA
jgi:hypothetical protein